MSNLSLTLPEQGQLVQLRNRFWLVQDVLHDTSSDQSSHRVILECLDDDNMGALLSVIWQHEIEPQVFNKQGLPQPFDWDNAAVFDAFITAIRWSSASVLEKQSLQSPFYAAIKVHEYQLEPVARALTIPRVNLLIADDVGLGKTIEAGLVVQELLARRRIRRILIVCPASLQQQWREEMQEKFQLEFHVIDRDRIQTLRREYGMHINPWNSYPRLITSMDFLKREQPLRLFREGLQRQDSPLRDWDLLIVDEAHNAAPSGRKEYAIDSDRTRMLRAIADHFENRLFLTATPHNGFTESFTALLELLDPLRFSRGPEVNQEQIQRVMIRRLKSDITESLGDREFAKREIDSLDITLTDAEDRMFSLLDNYTKSRLSNLSWNESLPVRFALTMLKKRLLSSPLAFQKSISTHLETLGAPEEMQPNEVLLERMQQRVNEDWSNDDEKALAEEDAIVESSRFFHDLTTEEQATLRGMANLVGKMTDSKFGYIRNWIEQHLMIDSEWNLERLVLFTEYKDTLTYLTERLAEIYGEDKILSLYGGMNMSDREHIKKTFQSDPEETSVRILVATDAASEGLNLQAYCRYLIHYEIPWNPNRMEQRNGRIDRHGQKAETVNIYHFMYKNREDSRFLQTIIDKVKTMANDLGSVGDVIATQVEEAMLGQRKEFQIPTRIEKVTQDVIRSEVMTDQRIREIRRQMERTRDDLSINPETQAMVLDSALRVMGSQGLEDATNPELHGQAYRLRQLPSSWQSLEHHLKNADGQWLDMTFNNQIAHKHRSLTLLHLNHPLMRQAIGTFRGRLWSTTLERGLSRVSYRVSSEYSVPMVIAYGRLVAVGHFSQRLHEEVIYAGAEIEKQELYSLNENDVQRFLAKDYDYPEIPTPLAQRLRTYFPHHERKLSTMLDDVQVARQAQLEQLAQEHAEKDGQAVQELIDERLNELKVRLDKEQKDQSKRNKRQLELFDRDEYLQYQEDLKWLKQKQDDLRKRRKTEPERVRQGYELRDIRVFPMALLYLLPERTVKGN